MYQYHSTGLLSQVRTLSIFLSITSRILTLSYTTFLYLQNTIRSLSMIRGGGKEEKEEKKTMQEKKNIQEFAERRIIKDGKVKSASYKKM